MRLVFALFLDEVPLAAANFHALCTQRYEGLGDGGAPLTYRRSPISRVSRGGRLDLRRERLRGRALWPPPPAQRARPAEHGE